MIRYSKQWNHYGAEASRICAAIILSIFGFLHSPAWAQQRIVVASDRPDVLARMRLPLNDSAAFVKASQQWIARLQGQGHLLASLDSLAMRNGQLHAFIYIGNAFAWAAIQADTASKQWMQAAGVPFKALAGKPMSPMRIKSMRKKLLQAMERRGHPFGKVHIRPLQWENANVLVSVAVETGPMIVFDSLAIGEEAGVKGKFLAAYLGFRKGKPYNQALVNDALRLLAQLPYLQLKKPPVVAFRLNQAYLLVDAEKRAASQASGILGLLFDPQRQRPILTGQVQASVENLFESGKKVEFQFNRIRTAAQQLQLLYEHPALLGSPIHLQAQLGYQQEDSTFVNFRRGIGIGYDTKQGIRIVLQATVADNRLNSRINERPQDFGALASAKTSLYGLQMRWQRLDWQQAPRKGWQAHIQVGAGEKRIRPLLPTSHPDYAALYGQLRQPQAEMKVFVQRFWPLGAQSTLLTGLNAGQLLGSRLYRNESLRLGGIQLLRGFDEYSVFSKGYRVGSAEYRLYFAGSSYLMAFADIASIAPADAPDYWAWGAGAGMAFQLKAGLFRMLYAVGGSPEQPASLQNAKVHFGLVSRF